MWESYQRTQAGSTGWGRICTEGFRIGKTIGVTSVCPRFAQSDGNYSYTWDGESQMKTAAGVTYSYDGDGHRVQKSTGTLYWYRPSGEVLAETDLSGNTVNEYVYFGGKRVALVPAAGNPLYYAEDTLGTSRVMVQADGTLCYDADFTPYGAVLQRFRYPDWQGTIRAESSTARAFTESLAFDPFGERYSVQGAPFNVDSFTGKPDQIVSDEYDFPARQEHNGQGRWISPDPARGTGNKYVYADNNPLTNVDPYGLETVAIVSEGFDMGTTTVGKTGTDGSDPNSV